MLIYNRCMQIVVISDVHCEGPGCPRDASFVAWLDSLEADGLWMLGDIFHVGWAFNGRLQPGYSPVFEALDRAVARGLQLVFIPGNHDFGLADVMAERWSAEVCGPHVREVDGTRFHLSHGDESDRTVGYRLVQCVLRSRLFAAFMVILGVRLGTALLRMIAGRGDAEGEEVWPQTKQLATSMLVEADVVLMGHAHVPWQLDSEDGTAAVLGPGLAGVRHITGGALLP